MGHSKSKRCASRDARIRLQRQMKSGLGTGGYTAAPPTHISAARPGGSENGQAFFGGLGGPRAF
eukprot:7410022-Pyramimonas_sp.AAC.1